MNHYIALAGGPRNEADERSIVLLQPDGSVVSHRRSGEFRRLAELRRAESLPGFTKRQGGRGLEISVSMKVPFTDPGLWERIEALLRIVGKWDSTIVSIDGRKPPSLWQLSSEVSRSIDCYRTREREGAGLDHCLGKRAPVAGISTFGCRFLKGVDLREVGERGAPWYEFGRLSEECRTFTVDKKAIEKRLRLANQSNLCTSCPAFSWEHVRSALEQLPERIDLENSERFTVKHSNLDASRPIGIKPRGHPSGAALRFGVTVATRPEGHPEPPQRIVPRIFYRDIAGQDAALQHLRDVCELPLNSPEYFASMSLTPHRGVILYGPPGNGKTLLAKAVATETNAHLELVNGPEILSKWVGQSEQNLRAVFERARALAPSIIVIDELDVIAPSRAQMTHQHEITLVSQLLVCLDGLNDRGSVFVIGTTNRLEAVDPALKRPGRFDYHIQVPLPSARGREAVLRLYLSRLARAEPVDLADTVAATPGWSGAELHALVTEAGLLAIKRGIRSGMAPNATALMRADFIAAVVALSAKREPRRRACF